LREASFQMDQIIVQDTNSQTRSQLIQIFRYVQAFDHLQNPPQQEIENQPWVLWFHDIPLTSLYLFELAAR
jgi:hypothetical protein